MSNGKKAPDHGELTQEGPLDEDGNPIWAGPSRSQVRREASAVSDLGLRLLKLPKARLATFPLSEEIRQAIELCARLTKGARARQLRLVAKMLRDLSPEELGTLNALVSQAQSVGSGDERLYEGWRRRMLEEGDAVLGEFVAEYPHADRQHLRQLVRGAKRQPPDARSARAARELLRAIRSTARGEGADDANDAAEDTSGEDE